jgi:hypothetical protein
VRQAGTCNSLRNNLLTSLCLVFKVPDLKSFCTNSRGVLLYNHLNTERKLYLTVGYFKLDAIISLQEHYEMHIRGANHFLISTLILLLRRVGNHAHCTKDFFGLTKITTDIETQAVLY